jgi:S-(hydroxymethyl)glutathione dehydrogenase / alcohol dehydrogenase
VRDQANLCNGSFGIMTTPRVERADGSQATCMTGLGTFSDYMTLDQSSVVKVETDLPDEQLALIGCAVTTGVGAALNTARIVPGSSVAVIGCGGVGQSVIQGARIAGAGHIIAVDPVELKRKTAEQLGATDLVDPSTGDAVAAVRALTGGRGADYAFEVIGLPETIQQAYKSARRGGTVVVVGMPRVDAMVTLSAWGLFYDEKRTLGCYYGSAQVQRDFPRFVELVETGRLDIGAMVSRRIKLDEVNDAFRAMEAGEVIRSVIV